MTKNEIKAWQLKNNLIIGRGKRVAWKLYCTAVYRWEFLLQTDGKMMVEFLQPRINAMFGIHPADSYDVAYVRAERRYNNWDYQSKIEFEQAAEMRATNYLTKISGGNK